MRVRDLQSDDHDSDGRRARFVSLLEPCYKQLESYALAMERDREHAFDLVGETLLRGWEHFDRLRDEKAFFGWLLTIARRVHRERRWRRRFFREESPGYADSLVAGGPSPDLRPDIDALYTALAQLPEKQREAIVLFELHGFSLQEVHALQGGSMSALKVRLHRGRKRLAELLEVSVDIDRQTGSTRSVSPDIHGSSDEHTSVTGHVNLLSTP